MLLGRYHSESGHCEVQRPVLSLTAHYPKLYVTYPGGWTNRGYPKLWTSGIKPRTPAHSTCTGMAVNSRRIFIDRSSAFHMCYNHKPTALWVQRQAYLEEQSGNKPNGCNWIFSRAQMHGNYIFATRIVNQTLGINAGTDLWPVNLTPWKFDCFLTVFWGKQGMNKTMWQVEWHTALPAANILSCSGIQLGFHR